MTLHRDEGQLKINAVSQATVDSDRANLRTATANVAQQQAILDEKTLRAPFSGRLGIRQVDYGQFISAGTKVVSLQTLDPIYLDFMLPQQAAGQIKIGAAIEARVEGFAEPFKGEVRAVDSKVNSTSRNLQIRARLPNPDRKLLPGMFATVEAPIDSPERLVTLPQTAIVYNTYGDVGLRHRRCRRQGRPVQGASERCDRRPRSRRSGRDPLRREARRDGDHRRSDQTAQRLHGQNQQFHPTAGGRQSAAAGSLSDARHPRNDTP